MVAIKMPGWFCVIFCFVMSATSCNRLGLSLSSRRYTMAAQDLVMRARGVLKDGGWKISNDRLGSGDDISVFIIPLVQASKQNQ